MKFQESPSDSAGLFPQAQPSSIGLQRNSFQSFRGPLGTAHGLKSSVGLCLASLYEKVTHASITEGASLQQTESSFMYAIILESVEPVN